MNPFDFFKKDRSVSKEPPPQNKQSTPKETSTQNERSAPEEPATQKEPAAQKELSHSEKVSAVYNNFNPETRKNLFPAGVQQMNGILCSLAGICGYDLNKADVLGYKKVIDLYIYGVAELCTSPQNSVLFKTLQPSENDLIKSPETAQAVRSYIKLTLLEGYFCSGIPGGYRYSAKANRY